jgi:hypothetical protein
MRDEQDPGRDGQDSIGQMNRTYRRDEQDPIEDTKRTSWKRWTGPCERWTGPNRRDEQFPWRVEQYPKREMAVPYRRWAGPGKDEQGPRRADRTLGRWMDPPGEITGPSSRDAWNSIIELNRILEEISQDAERNEVLDDF